MKNKKFRVIIDFDFSSKKKFEYDFKFVNVSAPGCEINILELTEYLKEVVKSIEKKHLDVECLTIKESKFYH